MSYGSLVIAGTAFPIERVWLSGGRVWFVGVLPGPLDCPGGPVTIFGSDGQGIGQGGDIEPITARAGEMMQVRVDMIFEQISDGLPPRKGQEAR